MTLWLTSDTHFGHVNIPNFRPDPRGGRFPDIYQHDEFLIGRWNNVVQANDDVLVVGDFLMGHKEATLARVVPNLIGNISLIPGNHDGPWSGSGSEAVRLKWKERYEDYGIQVLSEQDGVFINIGNNGYIEVPVCHFPYEKDDRHEARFEQWQPEDNGDWLLHGHVHDMWKIKGKQINVGVDVWDFAPVSADTISDLIKEFT